MGKRGAARSRKSKSKFENAIVRGELVRRKMMTQEGGSKSLEDTANLLGKNKRSLINLHRRGRLIASRNGEVLHFPMWQFLRKRPLRGLDKVLAKLSAPNVLDEWGMIGFFLLSHGLLGERRPVDLLRKNKLKPVLKAAEAYGS